MKYRRIPATILIFLLTAFLLAACIPDENKLPADENEGLDGSMFEDGVEPVDESFLYEFIGMDKTVSDADVLLMPSPYGDRVATLDAEVLSLTADFNENTGKYALYYCVKDESNFVVFKVNSDNGESWDLSADREVYLNAESAVTVVAGNCDYYVEKGKELSLKSRDGNTNIPLGVDNTHFIDSALFNGDRFYIYVSDGEGKSFVCVVEDSTVVKYDLQYNGESSNVKNRYVIDFGDKYISLFKRSESGVSDFTAAISKDGKRFFSFNGAYINADASSSENNQNGWTKCDKFVANGCFDVVNDNKNQDPVAGIYTYEVKDGKTVLRLYKLRKGGFAALYGDMNGSTVCSKTLTSDSDVVYIDYQTGATGYMDMEIVDAEGNVVFTAYVPRGNSISKKVSLTAEASIALRAGAVIRFRLYDAYLYRVYTEEGSL